MVNINNGVTSQYRFKDYRTMMEKNLLSVSEYFNAGKLDEQAVPSYLHPNKLMSWLFWQRIKVVINYLDDQNLGRLLDFGCGTGLLFPYFLLKSNNVTGFDVNTQASNFTIENLDLKGITLLDSQEDLFELADGSFDTIVALDVLEHVDNLTEICRLFSRLLKNMGILVISGPTESRLYKIGRKLAGYKEHFHKRNIFDVESILRNYFDINVIANLYPPITLFRVSVARK